MPSITDDLKNRNYLQAYSHLALAKDHLGLIRANLNEAFMSKTLSIENFIQIKNSLITYNLSIEKFEKLIYNNTKILSYYQQISSSSSFSQMLSYIDFDLKINNINEPIDWFAKVTQNMELFKTLEVKFFNNIQNSIDKKIENANRNIVLISLALLVLLLALAYLMFTIVRKILHSAHMLNEEFENSLVLLEQYKETVDKSFIISKTDSKGIICYANQAFCDISGYTQEELLGKPHSIIRHPDTPKQTFKDMWHNIKDLKKSWSGEIKNLAKDGSIYWMRIFINPILDKSGNVVEYIAMRTDITELQEDKERIRDSLGITTADFAEARQQAKEYENAMDEAWSVIRTDTDNIITYMNDTFINMSGYS